MRSTIPSFDMYRTGVDDINDSFCLDELDLQSQDIFESFEAYTRLIKIRNSVRIGVMNDTRPSKAVVTASNIQIQIPAGTRRFLEKNRKKVKVKCSESGTSWPDFSKITKTYILHILNRQILEYKL